MGHHNGPPSQPPDDPRNAPTGYPPSGGQWQSPQQMYPPPPPYNYPAPPPPHPAYNNGYYYYPPQQVPMTPAETRSARLRRFLLIFVLFLVSTICMMSLLLWFMLGSFVPDFHVASMRVSNFTTVKPNKVSGSWDVAVSVENGNRHMNIYLDEINSSVRYKDAVLGVAKASPMTVAKGEKGFINNTVKAAAGGGVRVEDEVVSELEQDWGEGMVLFSLDMTMKATFKEAESNEVRMVEMVVLLCHNLLVNMSPTGQGEMVPMFGNSCLLKIAKA